MFGQIDQTLRAIVILCAVFCSSTFGGQTASDPFEAYNRVVFTFNDKADQFLLKPIAKGYKFVTPDPVERGVGRIFDNLGEVRNVANDLLQGKFNQAANDTGRFLVNSTFGLAGFFDVAEDMGLAKSDGEDFGQTLGRWGVDAGPYLIIPLLGSSTLRDAPARFIDSYLNPIGEIDHIPTRNSAYGTDLLVTRARLLDAEGLISGDKYTFIREVFLQRRAYLVNDGKFADTFGEDFGEYEDDFYEYE